jgi:hypothetical protein
MTEGVGEKIFDASPNKLDGDINFALWWMNSDSVGTHALGCSFVSSS